MEEAKEKILEVKSSLETLLKCTDEVLSDVRKEGEREKWVQAVLAFCDKQKQAAQVVSSIDFEEPREKETPTKQSEVADPEPVSSVEEPVKEKENEGGEEEEEEEEEAPPPLPIKTRKPKKKGRKLPSKNLLAARAREEDEDVSAINLDESDLPDQVTEEEEKKEEEKPTRRKTLAVPIFSAGVMGELNKKLGARAGRKSSVEKEMEVESTEKKKEPVLSSPPKLSPIPKLSPTPKLESGSEKKAEPEIPPWKVELQQKRNRKPTLTRPPPKAESPAEGNELAAILARRKAKSGG